MTMLQVLGVGIFVAIFASLFFIVTKIDGWRVALGATVFSLVLSALVMLATFLVVSG